MGSPPKPPILPGLTFLCGVAALAACSPKEAPGTKIDDAGRTVFDASTLHDAPPIDDRPSAIDDRPSIRDVSEPEPTDAGPDDTGPGPADAVASDTPASDSVTTPEAAEADAAEPVTFETIIAEYRNWQPPTKSPEAVSYYIGIKCVTPSLREEAFFRSEHGKSLYLLDWTNSLAAQGVARKGVPGFEPGAAIVKEKLVRTDGGFNLVGLGIMVKREPGFDAANGDWDYGYWEKSIGLIHTPAQTAHCGGCHASVQGTDYVFMDVMSWLRDR